MGLYVVSRDVITFLIILWGKGAKVEPSAEAAAPLGAKEQEPGEGASSGVKHHVAQPKWVAPYAIIDSVQNGNFRLKLVQEPGSRLITTKFHDVPYADFSKFWEILYDAAAIQDKGVVMDWDSHSVKRSPEADEQDKIGCVVSALAMVDVAVPGPNVRIETSPKKRVFCLQDYKTGELLIVPRSKKACVDYDDKEVKSFRVKTETVTSMKKNVWIVPETMTTAKESGPKRPILLEPFWCVDRPTNEITPEAPDKNNVKLTNVRVLGAIAMRVNTDDCKTPAQNAGQFQVNIPVMTNVKEHTFLEWHSLKYLF